MTESNIHVQWMVAASQRLLTRAGFKPILTYYIAVFKNILTVRYSITLQSFYHFASRNYQVVATLRGSTGYMMMHR